MFTDFEWDPVKRDKNIVEHAVDFEDAIEIFKREVVTLPSHLGKGGEVRHVTIDLLDDVEIAVVHTFREQVCRLISARRASKHERRAYRKAFPEKSSQGKN